MEAGMLVSGKIKNECSGDNAYGEGGSVTAITYPLSNFMFPVNIYL